jgi:putative copper resistance protein D
VQRTVQAVLALAAIAASLLWAAASVAAMTASPIASLDMATVNAVLAATPLGGALLVRVAALGIMLAAAAFLPRNAVMALAGGAALGSLTWTGHAGAGEGLVGSLHQASDAVHLLAAATWTGALACFIRDGIVPGRNADRISALSRFTGTGTGIVALLVVTGVANGVFIAGLAGSSPFSAWSLLIGAKVSLFLAMLALAANNRWRLVPALASGRPGARGRLTRSLLLEMACALGIIALVAFAGVLDPSGGQ